MLFLEVTATGAMATTKEASGVLVAVIIAVVLIPLSGLVGWAFGFRPKLILDDETVTVVNPLRVTRIPLAQIVMAGSGYRGLEMWTAEPRIITAWAVQQSNAAQVTHATTRSDAVAARILAAADAARVRGGLA
ncbi:MAG: PH domain-containing protein [Jatrophihabitans sp.]|uniref:PH domain-containing protein n=1 Tax=Jatrophihabitans sp. TaxID=1932789 RepID=UPI003F8039CF